jgi:hypothetical protein
MTCSTALITDCHYRVLDSGTWDVNVLRERNNVSSALHDCPESTSAASSLIIGMLVHPLKPTIILADSLFCILRLHVLTV